MRLSSKPGEKCIDLGTVVQRDDALAFAPSRQRLDNHRALFNGEAPDMVGEGGVEFFLLPGHVFPGLPDACCGSGKAQLNRHVEKDHRVAAFESPLERAQVVAVDNPAFALQRFRKANAGFSLRDVGAIGFVPDHVEVHEWQPQGVA